MRRSTYTYTIDEQVIFVVDSNAGKSVTNDIENVVEDMNEIITGMGGTLDNFSIIYRDTDGIIDGVFTHNGQFLDFYHIGETDYHAAKLKIKTNEPN